MAEGFVLRLCKRINQPSITRNYIQDKIVNANTTLRIFLLMNEQIDGDVYRVNEFLQVDYIIEKICLFLMGERHQ